MQHSRIPVPFSAQKIPLTNPLSEGHSSEVAELQILMDGAKQKSMNVEYFLSLVRKYTDIQELTGEIIREFVEKIIVFKAEKVDGHRQQRIQIIYNAIGAVEIPDEKEAA